MTSTFSTLFLLAFAFTLGIRLWLKLRHIRFVAAHRTTVPTGFSERIALEAHQKAADYTVDRNKFALRSIVIDAALLLTLTLGGGLAWLHDFWSGHLAGLPYGLAMIFSLMLISGVIDLPFSLYQQFVIEARYGFNRMTLGLFFADLIKHSLVGIVIGAPVIAAVLWLMGAMGNYWWLYVWLFWCGFNLLILFVYPTWIAPLFNKFSPLEDGEMKSRIEALLIRCGFRSSGLFVMDGSKRSSHGNAYFTGFGQNKRIVFSVSFWQTSMSLRTPKPLRPTARLCAARRCQRLYFGQEMTTGSMTIIRRRGAKKQFPKKQTSHTCSASWKKSSAGFCCRLSAINFLTMWSCLKKPAFSLPSRSLKHSRTASVN